MAKSKRALKEVGDAIVATIKENVAELLSGVEADVTAFAEQIVAEAGEALASGNVELLAELAAQVKLIAEKHRLKAVNKAWATIRAVVSTALTMAMKLI